MRGLGDTCLVIDALECGIEGHGVSREQALLLMTVLLFRARQRKTFLRCARLPMSFAGAQSVIK
jgi:hypothetical protein